MSDFLFATPGFGSGAARVLDLAGLFDEYNDCRTPEMADAVALFNDFRTVGLDLLAAAEAAKDQAPASGR